MYIGPKNHVCIMRKTKKAPRHLYVLNLPKLRQNWLTSTIWMTEEMNGYDECC